MNQDEKEKREAAVKKAKEVQAKRNNDRLELMNSIADNAEEERDIEDVETPEQEAPEVPDDTQADTRYARVLQEEGATEEVDTQPPPQSEDTKVVNGEKYRRLMIGGQEKWFTEKEVIDRAQKVVNADSYLQQAAEGVKNAARLALPPKDEPVSLDEDQIADLYRKQALGDEEAIRALARLHARPSFREDTLQRLVDQRVSLRTEQAQLEEKSRDLLSDPYMERLFRARMNELREENPTMKLREAYTSIDNELRSAFPGFKASSIQKKLERKRALPAPPNAATRQGTEVQEEGEEDYGSAIESLAKARGQTPHVHRPTERGR